MEITNYCCFQVTDESMFKVQIIGRKEMAGLGSVAVVELVTKSTGVSLNQLLRDKKQRAEKEINNNTNKHCKALMNMERLFFLKSVV